MKVLAKPMGILFAVIMVVSSFNPAVADDRQLEELDRITKCYSRCTMSCYEDYCRENNLKASPRIEIPDICIDKCSDKCSGQSEPTIEMKPTTAGHPALPWAENSWLNECLSRCKTKPPHARPFCNRLCRELKK